MRDQHPSIQPSRFHHGYVLVMALVLIALAGSVLAIMAKRGVFDASDVLYVQAQFKERWAVYSLNKSILPQASKVMQLIVENETPAESTPNPQPPSVVRFEVQLGQSTYELVLADEQAKANVNQLLKNKKGKPIETAQAIRSLMERAQVTNVPAIELKPYTWARAPEVDKLHTLGQVFKNAMPRQLYSVDAEQKTALDLLTCWGDGKLNFRTAPSAVMVAICQPILGRGQIDKLIAARQRNPKISLNAALNAAKIAKYRLPRTRKLFTKKSTCYSLWIHCQAPRQTHHWLTIIQPEKSQQSQAKTAQKSPQSGKLVTTRFEW